VSNPYQPPDAPVITPLPPGHPSVVKAIIEAFSSLTLERSAILLGLAIPQLAFDLATESLQTSGRVGLFWLLLLATLPFSSLRAAFCMSAARSDRSAHAPSGGVALREAVEAWRRVFLADLVAGLITTLATLLLIVPGIYLAVRFSFVDVVAFENRLGPAAARKRSGQLVDGRFWPIAGLGLVFLLPGTTLAISTAALAETIPLLSSGLVVTLVSLGSSVLSALGSAACWFYYRDLPQYEPPDGPATD